MVSFVPVGYDSEREYEKEEGNINDIILRQIRKIGDICSKELTGGYWEKKPIKVGDGIVFTEEYHEDLREAYCNSINFIADLAYPNADNKFKIFFDSIDDKEIKAEIKERLKINRQIFRELNKMFQRFDFFEAGNSINEQD
jgi:hypothetical protein